MLSRGALRLMSARTRRGIALSWSVLFILSLVLQYATFALAPSALAVHDEGVFELDGNALASGAPGDDWSNLANADATVFVTDPLSQTTDKIFTGGGSKDDLNTTQWAWTTGSVPDKDNIEHAYAALYDDILYFGADRFANNGDAQMGFWFFKSGVGLTGGPNSGGFAPAHTVGDLLVLSHFENGGTVSTIELYEWVGSGGDTNGTLDLLGSGQVCTAAPVADKACAIANTDDTAAPWPYDAKAGPDDIFPANSFFEGGLDLAQVYGGNPPCFSSFLVETRSSQSVDSTLKDFANGDFNTCVPPDIETDASESSIQLGESVTDTATLTGNDGPASGVVHFFVCGPNSSATACASGGTTVGGAVPVTTNPDGGTATSAAFTPTATGWYCFRAAYTPNDASQYLEGSHTNATSECFRVVQARISITKTADPVGPVNAGDTIGFDITVTNAGDGTALGVSMTDPLPTGIAWSAGAPTGDTTGVVCGITAGTLTCTDASMAPGVSFSVKLSAGTDAKDCATSTHTASVVTPNAGSDTASATVVVRCPDIEVVKDAPNDEIPAGQDLVFTITTTNIGAGVAYDVTLTDTLPAGFAWTENSADCSITAGVLSCDFGDLGPGESASVTLTAPTSADPETGNIDCSEGAGSITIRNVAGAVSTNEGQGVLGNNSDDASIDVLCSALLIDKSFTGNTGGTDPDLGVPAAMMGDTLT